jgi:hypothetical protein
MANGWMYTEEFWKSYIGKMNTAPIPGSARGHETRYGARGSTDLLLVGGRLESKSDGAGTVYLKNYVPPKGESGDNTVFIAMCKAGMVDFSIVSYTRDLIETLPDGNAVRKCVESLYGERNDAVDLGAGAMEMKTNAEGQTMNKKCVAFAKSLIASGKLDKSSAWAMSSSDEDALLGTNKDDWATYAKWHMVEDMSATEDTKQRWKYPIGKSGKVYRSALRAIASRAAAQGLEDVSDTASDLIKEVDKKKGNRMEKAELLSTVGTMKQNAEITLLEVADAMGLKGQIKTDEDATAIGKLNAIKAIVGDGDPEALVKSLIDQAKLNAEAARAQVLSTAFGAKSNKVGDVETVNPAYQYAERMTAGLAGEKLNAAIKAFDEDVVMKGIKAGMADQDSTYNVIDQGGKPKANAAEKYSGSAVSL